ncbi:MAG: type I DNA topoisomerase [Oscillospiraceae bacterium]|nr:type I DNA topoisomerase [Oscillospiraceae bacterium]
MSILVIVESPAKAKTIKKYLGSGYEVVASMGHVRDLPAAKLSVDVKNGFAPKYAVIKGKENLVKELKKDVANSEKVFLATDPDREGEAISWHLATLLDLNLEDKNRVTFNEITKTGIKNGMESPRAVDMNLVNAQQARRILDRLVGYRLSPFVSQKIRRGLSAGRVQSVAVRMIVDREAEIKAFVPEEYWSIDAKFTAPSRKVFSASFYGDENGKVKIVSKEQADEILARLDGASYSVKSLKKGTRKKNPAPPFTTSTLQQEASRKLGFQTQKTMRTAQELYEGVDVAGIGTTGLITYMRTDSLRISEEARAQAAEVISSVFGAEYLPEKPRYYKTGANAQDGHEAIRPATPSLTPERVKDSLTSDQYKLYNLIWKRFMASLMASCVQDTVKLEIAGADETDAAQGKYCLFTAAGYSIRFDGFTKLYEISDDTDDKGGSLLPELKVGDNAKLKELVPSQHFTLPPPRFTEASLVKEFEEKGIGRPSTYSTIITTIVKRNYVKREAKQFVPTELGEATTKLLKDKFPRIVNVKFTAQMEDMLDRVDSGEVNYVEVLDDFYSDFEKSLDKAKTEMKDVKIQLEEDITDIPCEKCGRMMVIKTGRYGRFLACPGYPECKNAKPLILETNALCPKCGAKVIERKTKKGYTFYGCSNWPKCDFMSWDKPTGENCPKCGKSLFKKKGGMTVCLNEGCGYERKDSKKGKKSDE